MSNPARDHDEHAAGEGKRYPHLPRYHALNCTPEENERIRSAFFIFFDVFRVVVWAAVLVWSYPHALDWVGGRELARWIIAHGWIRWIVAPPLAVCAFISVLQPVNSPSDLKAADDLAESLGGTVVPHGKLDPSYGLPSGPALRVPVGAFTVDVRAWSRDRSSVTIATALVTVRGSFRFIAHGSGREPAFLGGLSQHAMGAALDQLRDRTDDPHAQQAAAEMSFATSDPVALGHEGLDRACVLRTSDAPSARALFATTDVAQALLALHAITPRWSWSLIGNGDGGAELRLERPGSLRDADAVNALLQPMRAALEALAAAGIVVAG